MRGSVDELRPILESGNSQFGPLWHGDIVSVQDSDGLSRGRVVTDVSGIRATEILSETDDFDPLITLPRKPLEIIVRRVRGPVVNDDYLDILVGLL
jgi:hypothetical protein